MKTQKEIMDYFKEYKDGTIIFYDSIDDYIVSRFLINQGFLREGLIFGCQSIEKMLKSFILLIKKKISKKNNLSHNPFDLKEELKENFSLNLEKYNDLLKRLFGHYQSRYMDNSNQVTFKKSWELKEIDELYLYLLENLPLISEIKYKARFFQYLFSKHSQDNYSEALKEHNDLLKKKIPEFKVKWETLSE